MNRLFTLFLVLSLASCGGGESSGKDSSTLTPSNTLPAISVDNTFSVHEGESVVINASASDNDGSITSISWSFNTISRNITISDRNTLQPSFVAPIVEESTEFILTVTVTDNSNGSASKTVTVIVEDRSASGQRIFPVMPLSNIHYRTFDANGEYTDEGYTDENGGLNCSDGETVTYALGAFELGTSECKDFLTVSDFANGVSDINNAELLNRMTLLQTADEDNDVSNGIQISNAVKELGLLGSRTTPNYSLDNVYFVTTTEVQQFFSEILNKTPVTAEKVKADYQETVNGLETFFAAVDPEPTSCENQNYVCIPDSNRPIKVGVSFQNLIGQVRSPSQGSLFSEGGYPYLSNFGSYFSYGENLHDIVRTNPETFDIRTFAAEVNTGVVTFYRDTIPHDEEANFLWINDKFAAYLPGLAVNTLQSQDNCGHNVENTLSMALPAGTYQYGHYSYSGNMCVNSGGIVFCGVDNLALAAEKQSTFSVEVGACTLINVTTGSTNSGSESGSSSLNGEWISSGGTSATDEGNPKYQLVLNQQQEVTISLSSDIDTYLMVLDENGNVIHFNDDANFSKNSQITVDLPAGNYTLVTGTYYSDKSGTFTLEVLGSDFTLSGENSGSGSEEPPVPSGLSASLIEQSGLTELLLTFDQHNSLEQYYLYYRFGSSEEYQKYGPYNSSNSITFNVSSAAGEHCAYITGVYQGEETSTSNVACVTAEDNGSEPSTPSGEVSTGVTFSESDCEIRDMEYSYKMLCGSSRYSNADPINVSEPGYTFERLYDEGSSGQKYIRNITQHRTYNNVKELININLNEEGQFVDSTYSYVFYPEEQPATNHTLLFAYGINEANYFNYAIISNPEGKPLRIQYADKCRRDASTSDYYQVEFERAGNYTRVWDKPACMVSPGNMDNPDVDSLSEANPQFEFPIGVIEQYFSDVNVDWTKT